MRILLGASHSLSRRVPRSRRGRLLQLLGLVVLVLGLAATGLQHAAGPAQAQAAQGTVLVLQIRGEIDLGLASYLTRSLREAKDANVQAAVLEIDTPGGRLDAVLQMRDALLRSPLRTVAFVDRTAFSAGALIALASQEIYMAPGATMGAATPVGNTGETASEKVISAVRSTFRSTAELRGREPRIAEAMVDPTVEIPGLVDRGQLLTLTTVEALAHGYADGMSVSRQDLLSEIGLASATIRETSPGLAENLVRFLTTPVVASLMVSLGVLLIIADFSSGGVGLPGAAGLGLLAAFFWGHSLAGLAGWEGIALVLLGLTLIGVEIFLIPGFGIAGMLGTAALLGGVFISLISDTLVTTEALVRAGTTVVLTFVMLLAGAFIFVRYLPAAHRFSGVVLRAQVGYPRSQDGEPLASTVGRQPASLRGASGVALSDLRPGGFAEIDGQRVDVVTRGDYIEAGEPVEVTADEGYRRVVRRLEEHAVHAEGESRSDAAG